MSKTLIKRLLTRMAACGGCDCAECISARQEAEAWLARRPENLRLEMWRKIDRHVVLSGGKLTTWNPALKKNAEEINDLLGVAKEAP